MRRNIIDIVDAMYWKIRWKKQTSEMKEVGENCKAGKGFSVIGAANISIGNNFSASKNLALQTWEEYRGEKTGKKPELIIGNSVSIMNGCQISCMSKIEIGDGTLLGDNVFITDNFHGESKKTEKKIPPIEKKLYSKGNVYIGKNIWIGRNVCIMPGVTIGDGAIIGANAVVTKNIPVGAVAAGVPAIVIDRTAMQDQEEFK